MENPHLVSLEEDELPPECDVGAVIAMLDYLIMEISRVDIIATHCLLLARKSLMELVERPHTRAN